MKYFEIFLLLVLILSAIGVALSKRLLIATILFSIFSLIMSIIWIILRSPDLAITEAAVGAGITSILFFITLKKTGEIGKDE